MYTFYLNRRSALLLLCVFTVTAGLIGPALSGFAEDIVQSTSVIQRVAAESDRIELTVSSSRILTLETRIPRVQVNNPELLSVTPLSATEIQVSAKKPGVTQINLWDEKDEVHSIDVIIYGDVRELELALKIQYPSANIRVFRYSNSLVLNGVVDRPDHVSPIMRLAEDYANKVVNNMVVASTGKIMLNVKVMEVSRTKLRRLGFDFAQLSSGGYVASMVSGLLQSVSSVEGGGWSTGSIGGETFSFGIVDGSDAFFGVLNALEQNDLLKVLAEPVLVTVSGRPAQFNVGGEFPILVPQSLGTVSIEYKKYGTQVDFLPVIMGDGNIRLEIWPRVSEIDNTRSVVMNDIIVPGLRVREINTAVEVKAGQTIALAGLIQERTEAQRRGLPFVSNIPWLGVPFRTVEERVNEIELLIVVTPEYIDGLDPCDAPHCYPGTGTTSPGDCQLYFGGHLEVPRCDSECGPGCGPDGGSGVHLDGSSMMLESDDVLMEEGQSILPGSDATEMSTPSQLSPQAAYKFGTSSTRMPRSNLRRPSMAHESSRGTRSEPSNPNHRPMYVRDVPTADRARGAQNPARTDPDDTLGLIGPIGYDIEPVDLP